LIKGGTKSGKEISCPFWEVLHIYSMNLMAPVMAKKCRVSEHTSELLRKCMARITIPEF
jgi:hypothetical protein